MAKRLIAVSSLLAAVGLVGVAVHVQTDRTAFTHSAEAAPPTANLSSNTLGIAAGTERSPSLDVQAASDSESSRVIEMAPVRISAPTHRAQPAAPVERALEPCSRWREVGPTYIDNGVAKGLQRVRELC